MNSYYGYYYDENIKGWVKVNQFFFGVTAQEALEKLKAQYPGHSTYDVSVYNVDKSLKRNV
ncbi:MAG TPA: hypothetical protein PLI68_08245 [Bacteroidia bacterium]|nr:hypothetical protein [Bacteroidia bacterium]